MSGGLKKVEEMTLEELWELFPIVLAPHDDRWARWAEEEIDLLRKLLEGIVVACHHVGSTAIKGIWAKPTVDILAVVSDITYFSCIKDRLLEAGYLLMKESERRMCLVKGYTPMGFAERVFHVHIRLTGDIDEVYFRDYLNSNPDVAKEYEALKLSLCKRYEHDRDGYTDAKTDFIKYYTAIAKGSLV